MSDTRLRNRTATNPGAGTQTSPAAIVPPLLQPGDRKLKAGSQPLIVQRESGQSKRGTQRLSGQPGPRRERSRSLQHVPTIKGGGLGASDSAPALPRPPRPKSPAPAFSRSTEARQAAALHPLRRRSAEISNAGRDESAQGSRSQPAGTEGLKKRKQALQSETFRTTAAKQAPPGAARHFSADTRYRIKRRSTPPEFSADTSVVEDDRPVRCRSNPTARKAASGDYFGRAAKRIAISRSESQTSESESDSPSSSTGEEGKTPPAMLLSTYGQFQRYVTAANLQADTGRQKLGKARTRVGPARAGDHETVSMLADMAPKRILHVMGLCERFVQLEHAKYCDPLSGAVHFSRHEPDFYSTVRLDVEEFADFYHVHCALRQYLHEQMVESTLMKDYDKQLGILFIRIREMLNQPQPGGAQAAAENAVEEPAEDKRLEAALADLSADTRELVDAVHGARSRGTLAAPNWAASRILPRTAFILVKRMDALFTVLLLEDPELGYDAINAARQKLMKYLLFDSTVVFLIQQQPNPFLIQGADFKLYARLHRALSDQIQNELAHGSGQFFQGLIRNTNTLGLNPVCQEELARRAQASTDKQVRPRLGSSPRTNFIARTLKADAQTPEPARQLHDAAWVAAFLNWIESSSFPSSMQQGFRQVLEENRNNPDVLSIQSACVAPIHAYALDKRGRDAKVDQRLIRLIRKLRNETFEIHRIEVDEEQTWEPAQ